MLGIFSHNCYSKNIDTFMDCQCASNQANFINIYTCKFNLFLLIWESNDFLLESED